MIQAGDLLGDYEIVREVGRGSMGIVYEARQASLDRVVAVKVLMPHVAGDPMWVDRFRAEAQAAARLSHPGIAPIFSVGSRDGVPWFAMEFIEGKTAADLLREEPLDARRAALIVRDAALALDHAHGQGVVHRDVKPGNLMVRRDGRVLLTDFGLAKHLGSGSLTATGSLVGTPFYMSPEQVSGERDVGPSTDVYALGVALYEMLCGRPPFVADNAVALLRLIADREPTPLRRACPTVPQDLETVVMTCLEKRPDRRYPSARALADDLDRFLRGEPVARRRPGPVERVRRFVQRHRAASAVAATALVLGVVAAVLVGRAWDDREKKLRAEIDSALAASETALERGDLAAAEQAVAAVEQRTDAPPAALERVRAQRRRVTNGFLSRLKGANPDEVDAQLTAWSERTGKPVPVEELEGALGVTTASLRVEPAQARVEIRRAGDRRAEPLYAGTGSVSDRRIARGAYRIAVSAPGHATLNMGFLAEPGGNADLEVRLPRSDSVPPGMVLVGGHVRMPRPDGTAVDLSPFFLDERETTVADYARFLAALPPSDRAALTPRAWVGGKPPPDDDALPVTGVTWSMADAYATWAKKRLPTQAELAFAAAIGTGRHGEPGSKPNTLDAGFGRPLPVDRPDSRPNVTGAYDLVGNVAEWTGSTGVTSSWQPLIVGGSFRDQGGAARSAFPDVEDVSVGFRCALGAASVRPAPQDAEGPVVGGRRYRVDPDGALVEWRDTRVDHGGSAPMTFFQTASTELGGSLFELRAARAADRAVRVERLPPEGPAYRHRVSSRLHFDPPLRPGGHVNLTLEEVRTPPGPDVLYVRHGSRVDVEVPASGPVEVAFPEGTTISRLSEGPVRVVRRGNQLVVRRPHDVDLQARLRVEAIVPALRPADAELRAAVAESDRLLAGLRTLDVEPYLARIAPEYDSDLMADRARAANVLRAFRTSYARWEIEWSPWGADWQGDCIVIRRRMHRLLLHRPDGTTESPTASPDLLETYLRRDGAGGWLAMRDIQRKYLDAGEWKGTPLGVRNAKLGLHVAQPFANLRAPLEPGLADFALRFEVAGGAVEGEVRVFQRLEGAGHAITGKEYERFGYRVVSERERPHHGRPAVEVVVTAERAGLHLASRRLSVRRGEGAVLLFANCWAPKPEEALAALVGHKADIDVFFRAVEVEDLKPPR